MLWKPTFDVIVRWISTCSFGYGNWNMITWACAVW